MFTDEEHRILLSAMTLEHCICKDFDARFTGEPHEKSLSEICESIGKKIHDIQHKYKWHDLRKDPDDVPKENGHYLIVYQWIGDNTGIAIEAYNPYDGFHTPPEYPCIAWKEIEPFEVTE